MVDLVPAEGSRKDSFATDTEISKTEAKGAAGKARELARWEDVVPQPHQAIELDEEATRLGTQWDQFEVNHKLFGVSTSFDENIYTIPLDRSSRAYKEREAEAQRIAAEMMRNVGTGGNVHLAEERGLAIDDSQIDEEDRYGAVVRAAPASSEDCAKRPHHPSSGMSQSASARHRKSIVIWASTAFIV